MGWASKGVDERGGTCSPNTTPVASLRGTLDIEFARRLRDHGRNAAEWPGSVSQVMILS